MRDLAGTLGLGLATGASLIRLEVAPVATDGAHGLEVPGLDPGVIVGRVADPSDEVLEVVAGSIVADDEGDFGDVVGVGAW